VVSVERGHDPREFALVPFGGAGPLHSSAIAASLNMPRVMVPPAPGILCAMGMLISDLRHDLIETRVQPLAATDRTLLGELFAPLLQRAADLLAADGVAPGLRELNTILDMRYIGQSYELMIPVDLIHTDADNIHLAQAFHQAHRQKFGHADDRAPVEIVNLRVLAIGKRPPFILPQLPAGETQPPADARRGNRDVYFAGDQCWHPCPIWRREALLAGNEMAGPAVIEEVSSTTLLRPGDVARIDTFGNILIDIAR
jgi:N-methylhydantoinase A